jgi:type IV secretion system protein VirB11
MLTTAIGPHMNAYLDDPKVVEVMLNPDGFLWVDRLGEGRSNTGHKVVPQNAQRVIELVASSTGAICNDENPIISAWTTGGNNP